MSIYFPFVLIFNGDFNGAYFFGGICEDESFAHGADGA